MSEQEKAIFEMENHIWQSWEHGYPIQMTDKSTDVIIKALQKQIPVKPELIMKTMSMCLTKEECGTAYTCDCGAYVGYLHEYCNDCGQKLDWED